jgi:hypothetical protein
MLDEDEFASVFRLYGEAIMARKTARARGGLTLAETTDDYFQPVRRKYEELTGMRDCHHNAVMHHRLALYGPLFERCKKPLRTPSAKLCGSCMHPVARFCSNTMA